MEINALVGMNELIRRKCLELECESRLFQSNFTQLFEMKFFELFI